MKSYAIADFPFPDENAAMKRIERLVELGVDFVQVRSKNTTDRMLFSRSRDVIRMRSSQSPTRFIVNGRADVALAAEADGVHLTSHGIPVEAARQAGGTLLVGRSCHSVTDVDRAAAENADYVLLGPRFSPRSKVGEPMISDGDLDAAATFGIPIFVLGGVSAQNMGQLAGKGMTGVAGITLFMFDEPLQSIVESVRKL